MSSSRLPSRSEKLVYFASDFHLGVANSRGRELTIVQWLREEVALHASHLYLVGDLFDFWFEYKHVIPKGYVRFLGALAHLVDSGVEVIVFTGNHDLWMRDYLEKEIGARVCHDPMAVDHLGVSVFVGHGDGLGPADRGYKLLKRFVFRNKVCQWFFERLHPNFAFGLANFFSSLSRAHTEEERFLGPSDEWLIRYCEKLMSEGRNFDYYVFGHRHLPIYWRLSTGASYYVNLGEWFTHCTYAVLDSSGQLKLRRWRRGDMDNIVIRNVSP